MQLPAPRNPFPVKYPYIVRSDMYKLGKQPYGLEEDDFFLVDSDYETVVRECLEVLQQHPQHSRAYLRDDIQNLTACLWEIADLIARDQPEYSTCVDNVYHSKLLGLSLERGRAVQFDPATAIFPDLGETCFEHIKQLEPFEQLCDLLRLSVEEDLVIGRVNPADASDVMECILVPIPSRWDPAEKVGLSFANVHVPIPDSERLVAASPNLVNAIMTKGDFVRYNWTMAINRWNRNSTLETDHLERNAEIRQLGDPHQIMDAIYFRTERQTLRAWPHLNRYLFTIHTYMHPLSTVLTTKERITYMLEVLETMEEDIRDKRGIISVAYEVLQQLV